MECKKEKNAINCNCSYTPCKLTGICCECVDKHRRAHELPACFFPNYAEKTFDRSYAHFVELYNNNKL